MELKVPNNYYFFKVKQDSQETPIPVPDEKLLAFIKQTTEEGKRMELAEQLLYQWLQNQPFFPNDYSKLDIR